MARRITPDTADVSTIIRVLDQDGLPYESLTSATAGLSLWYRRQGAVAVAISPSDLAALTTAHTDGGIKHIDDGYYRLDLPDLACAAGADEVQVGGTATNYVILGPTHPLGVNQANLAQVLGTALPAESVAGRDAAALGMLLDVATPVLTAASVNQTGDCYSSAQRQQMAREAHGVSGTVWHVKYAAAEDLTKDGLSWATAKETAGVGVKTVIEAASAGDLVLIGAGTFALGNNNIVTPSDVSWRGASTKATIITSTKQSVSVVAPGNRSQIGHCTIRMTGSGFQYPFGLADVNGVVDAVLHDAKVEGHVDGIYFSNVTGAANLVVQRCVIYATYDAITVSDTDVTIDVFDSTVIVQGPGVGVEVRGIAGINGKIRVYNCIIDIQDGSTATTGALAGGGFSIYDGIVELHNCKIYSKSATGTVYSLRNGTYGTLVAVGCKYDRTKTSGMIIDIPSHALDSNGLTIQAAANLALVANNLDHLALTATAAADMTTEVADNTILARVLAGGDTSTFDPATMSQKDILADTNEVQGKLPSRDYLAGSAAATGEMQTDAAAAITAYDPPTNAEMELRTKLAADYADKATLDVIAADVAGLDGAAMRGTDNAALAATALSNLVWTDAKAGYLTGAVALEATLTAIKGAGWTTETLAAIDVLIDAITSKLPAGGALMHAAGAAVAKSPATIAAGDIATDAIDAASIKADAVTKIQAGLGTSTLTSQQVRDAMKLAPSAGTPVAGSVDTHLDDILADTGTDGVVVAAASKTGYSLSGSSGGAGPKVSVADDDVPVTAPKNGTARLCCRVFLDGVNITQADISTITYSIYLLTDGEPDTRTAVTGHAAVSLTIADVIFDALQTDSQASNYNFRHTPPIATYPAFTVAGRNYLVEYIITPTAGEKIIRRFTVNVI